MNTKIEQAKGHLATCMERDDFPSHNCACNCDDVAELLAENERLKADLEVKNEVQSWRVEWLALEAEVERLRATIHAGDAQLERLTASVDQLAAENEQLRELAGTEFSVTVRSGDYYVTVDLETAERVETALTPLNWVEVGARFRRAWSL